MTKQTPLLDLEPISHAKRIEWFGHFAYTHHPQPPTLADPVQHIAPNPGDPEHVEISEIWKRQYLTTVDIPHVGRRCQVHKAIEKQFLAFWEALYLRELTKDVLTFNGCWASRYKRQPRWDIKGRPYTFAEISERCRTLGEYELSNHCWGTAFDINAMYNRMGKAPAPAGERGSVHAIVPVAAEFGFFWGGKFHHRVDGMHFEAAIILP